MGNGAIGCVEAVLDFGEGFLEGALEALEGDEIVLLNFAVGLDLVHEFAEGGGELVAVEGLVASEGFVAVAGEDAVAFH